MKPRLVSALAITLALAGCPASVETPDAATTPDAPSPLDARVADDAFAPSLDAPSPPDAPIGDDAPASDASSGEDAPVPGDGGPRTDAPPSFEIALADPAAYGNCFMGPPDPLLVFWSLRGRGTPGDTVRVESATLRVRVSSSGYDETQTLTLDTPSFVIPGSGSFDEMQRKTMGAPAIPICSFCSASATGELTLEVTTTSGGAQTLRATDLAVSCVF